MTTTTPSAFLDALRQHRLLEISQLDELNSLNFPDPKAMAKELIQRGWLTPYQANQLLNGKGHELVLGSYILLERLGEGGMGQVFKARHRNLGRISALKLIRKERLENAGAVKRFQREVRSAAALSHPNIVLAFDADEIAGTHLMVMEYVDGAIDLAKLVKQKGPLPVDKACAYIRQAALGLQHAFERGMVHRDIKPANLLLTTDAKVVKVLDMGLARLNHPADEDEGNSTMTQEGAIMGTPDYIAPEQALDTHRVDIRADLYSLGCTFYYLLTGRVPFPGGTLFQKLSKHQTEEPLPVEQLCPDVTPEIAGVVRKLMAKKPADRYQTPAELAAALAVPDSGSGSSPGDATGLTLQESFQAPEFNDAGSDALVSTDAQVEKPNDTVALEPLIRLGRPLEKQGRRLWYWIAGIGMLVVAATTGLYFFSTRGDADEPDEVENVTPPARKPAPKQEDDPLRPARLMLGGKWHYIGPFDNAQMKGFDTSYPPEKEIDLQAVYPGKRDKPVRWQEYREFEAGIVLDFLPLFPNADDKAWSCIYLYHEIEVPTEVSVPISLGSDDTLTVWLNDVRLVNKKINRPLQPHDDFTVLKLKPGKNKLLVKVCQGTGEWGFFIGPVAENDIPFYLRSGFDPWCKEVAALPADKQVEAMTRKLRELNRGWEGKPTSKVDAGVVTELTLVTNGVKDISPVRALTGLKKLSCAGHAWYNRGYLSDLAPLEGMKLKWLALDSNRVSDLSPLKGMELTYLSCHNNPLIYLVGLEGMKLTYLHCGSSSVADLSPLKDTDLTDLYCDYSQVADLTPLGDLKLKLRTLSLGHSKVSDLGPLQELNLKSLNCSFTNVVKLAPLREMKSLTHLNLRSTKVADLMPLQDLKLTNVDFGDTPVSDLMPLSAMKTLTQLTCFRTQIADLSPLSGLRLTNLNLDGTKITDLTLLQGLPLTYLNCSNTTVADLTPVVEMPLKRLYFYGTRVSDVSPLGAMKLQDIGFTPKTVTIGVDALRQMKTLAVLGIGWETKNQWPALEFWKKFDAGEFSK